MPLNFKSGTVVAFFLILTVVVFSCNLLKDKSGFIDNTEPAKYAPNDSVPLNTGSIRSYNTYAYYPWSSVPGVHHSSKTNTTTRTNDLNSPPANHPLETCQYELKLLQNVSCQVLCTVNTTRGQVEDLISLIKYNYRAYWYLDWLPALYYFENQYGIETVDSGWPLGYVKSNKVVLNNHVQFSVSYNKEEPGDTSSNRSYTIVGFRIVPFSLNPDCKLYDLEKGENVYLDGETKSITWSYSVIWTPSSVKWSERWDFYISKLNAFSGMHFTSMIFNGLVIFTLFLLLVLLLVKVFKNDLQKYNLQEFDEDESGWKLVHGDVFRPPHRSMLLSAMIGNGVQFLLTCLVLSIVVIFNHVDINLHFVFKSVVLIFAVMSLISGYVSCFVFKSMKGERWKMNSLLNASLFPGFSLALFFSLNVGLFILSFSPYFRFITFCKLFFVWLLAVLPLNFIGSFIAWHYTNPQHPVRITNIPRQIPPQPLYINPIISFLISGFLPFTTISLQIFYFVYSINTHYFKNSITFTLLSAITLIMSCVSMPILMCYLQLCCENYKWWWMAFCNSGSGAFYYLIYSFLYILFSYNISNFAILTTSLCNSIAMSAFLFLLTGSIGFIFTYIFVNKLYASIKID